MITKTLERLREIAHEVNNATNDLEARARLRRTQQLANILGFPYSVSNFQSILSDLGSLSFARSTDRRFPSRVTWDTPSSAASFSLRISLAVVTSKVDLCSVLFLTRIFCLLPPNQASSDLLLK